MQVMLDSNIVIDILDVREPFFQAAYNVYTMAVNGEIDAIASASSITDVYYILRKSRKSAAIALQAILDTLEVVTLVDTKAEDIYTAAKLPMTDFEDAVIAAAAQREKADYIITRNTKDFSGSPVQALSPADFLEKIKSGV